MLTMRRLLGGMLMVLLLSGVACGEKQSVSKKVNAGDAAAQFDAADIGGHSLRSGFATSAAAAGTSERLIATQTGHKSLLVLRRYIQAAGLFTENAAAGLM